MCLCFSRPQMNVVLHSNIQEGIRHYYDDLDFKNILDFVQEKVWLWREGGIWGGVMKFYKHMLQCCGWGSVTSGLLCASLKEKHTAGSDLIYHQPEPPDPFPQGCPPTFHPPQSAHVSVPAAESTTAHANLHAVAF